MNTVQNAVTRGLNYISSIRIPDVIDILVVAFLIYELIMLIRRTNSTNLAKGLLIFVIALWLSAVFKLTMINYLLRRAVEIGLIALVVLFQPELRRILERIGSRLSPGKGQSGPTVERAINQTVIGCTEMSDSKTGALIVFERRIKLNDIMSTGTELDSEVSAELLKNLFYNKAPLHDGAVIIRNGRIASAGCVLPLSKSTNLSKDLGMRHRAGIGLSEQSDAIVIIVSEESGSISCAKQGTLKRHLKPSALDKLLKSELISDEEESRKGILESLFSLFGNEGKEVKSDEKDS